MTDVPMDDVPPLQAGQRALPAHGPQPQAHTRRRNAFCTVYSVVLHNIYSRKTGHEVEMVYSTVQRTVAVANMYDVVVRYLELLRWYTGAL